MTVALLSWTPLICPLPPVAESHFLAFVEGTNAELDLLGITFTASKVPNADQTKIKETFLL